MGKDIPIGQAFYRITPTSVVGSNLMLKIIDGILILNINNFQSWRGHDAHILKICDYKPIDMEIIVADAKKD